MRGSGLEEVLEEVYAGNTIPHMMSGKAVARSVRGHFLVQSALTTLLIEGIKDKINLSFMEAVYEQAVESGLDEEQLDDLIFNEAFENVSNELEQYKEILRACSRTAKLWLLYMYYVNVLKMFIFAERTSDWTLHIYATSKMLNLFAATGRRNYAKSARLYVQQMNELESTHPWLYRQFMNGHFAIKRSNNIWAGIWSDLSISNLSCEA